MSTHVAPIAPEISPNDPRLTAPSPDYSLIEIGPDGRARLTERYRARLQKPTQDYVLAMRALGRDSLADRVANCGAMGSIDTQCDRGAYAHANHIVCHDPGCPFCGRGRAVLGRWARERDLHRIASVAHIGIELVLPLEALDAQLPKLSQGIQPARPHDPVRAQSHSYLSPRRFRESRDRIMALADKLRDLLGPNSLRGDVYTPGDTATVRVRIAAPSTPIRHQQITELWKAIAGPGAWCEIRRAGAGAETSKLLEWLCSGGVPLLMLDGELRAQYRQALKGAHMISARGDHYRTMTPEELAEHKECKNRNCPICPDAHPLTEIIPEERTKQTVEEIESRFRIVDWRSSYNPFDTGRPSGKVEYKRPLIDNFAADSRECGSSRYGPS